MKKITFLLFLMFLFVGFSYAQKNQKPAVWQSLGASYKIVMNGDAVSGIRHNISITILRSATKKQNSLQHDSPLYNTTFTYTGCSTIYDLVSNATPQNIIQDPTNPARIHIVCMSAPMGDPISFPNRRSKYYYSSNNGTSWMFIGDVPNARSGFPAITLAPNGNILIGNHNTNVAYSSKFYYDAATGLGSFTELYKTPPIDYLWPRVAFTSSLTNTNKFLSIQTPNGRDSCFLVRCTSLSPSPGTFTSWNFIYSDQAETYSIARGADGRIGVVYHNNDVLFPNDYGDVFFMESTDRGATFGTPTKIFDAVMSPSGDNLASLRGLQIVYQGNVPKVAFEVVKQTTTSSYYPNDGSNHIRFWSTSLPGIDPNRSISIADTLKVGYHPYINSGNGDVFTNICRPTIGVSSDGTGLFVAFMVPSDYAGGSVDTISFMDVYIIHSTNYGSNWFTPVRVNSYSPVLDWTYPCISPTNDNNSNYYYANLLILSDSVPGTYVNNQLNGASSARYTFVRVEIPKNLNPPGAPTLIYPANGATNVPQPIAFDWTDVTGATSYGFQVSLNSTFTNLIVDVSGITNSGYTLPAGIINQATLYYWRANATGPTGTGPWSSVWSFTTGTSGPPGAPVLSSPPNGSTCVSLTPTLDWQDVTGATSYSLQVSTVPTFSTTVIDVSGLAASQYFVLPGVLANNTQYYWRANATNSFGTSYWSNTFTFVTAPPLPLAPTLIAPPNGSTNMPLTPMLYWNGSTGATSYRVQISQSSSFTTMVFDSTLPLTQVIIPAGKLMYFTTYYWRVNASNCGGNSSWSTHWAFVTGPVGIQTYSAEIPTEFKLYNNFPNPFNPATKIRFDLPKASNVKISVYDIIGKEIATLVNENLGIGKFEVEWKASSLPSGIYFYKLESESFIDVKKLVLIK